MKLTKYYSAFKTIILYDKIGRQVRKVFLNHIERNRLRNSNFTIFSQNCIGSIWYHDLGQRFCSPTINMKFRPDDFVKFLENIDHYLKTDINFLKNSDKPYPVGLLDDVYIEFVHYHSETEVLKKWIERKNRINWNNVCYIACDGGMSENAKKKYLDLPINNKVLFTADPFIADSEYSMYVGGGKVPDYKRCSIVYAGGSHDSIGADARLLNFCSIFGHRYYNRLFDYVNFLNSLK